MQKITIVGAGAIGLWMGTQLGVSQAAGAPPIGLLARGATLAALQQNGMRLRTSSAQVQCACTAVADAAALGVQDLVVISVKAPALREVAQQIAPLLGPQTVVLSAMNGVPWWFLQGFGGAASGHSLQAVDADGTVARSIAAQQVLGCVVHASCSSPASGVAQLHFGNKLIVGEPAGGSSTRLAALHARLQSAGFETLTSPQIQRDIWYKLWGNMTVNPISAITGATTDKILGDNLVRGFVSAVMLEAKAIGERIGIPIADSPEDRHAVTTKLGAFKTSMLQDVQAGKAVELDALVGAVRELGMLTGVATPFTDVLMGLARLHAQGRGLYPCTVR
jgi:2-dehydropantoate 2-reductase